MRLIEHCALFIMEHGHPPSDSTTSCCTYSWMSLFLFKPFSFGSISFVKAIWTWQISLALDHSIRPSSRIQPTLTGQRAQSSDGKSIFQVSSPVNGFPAPSDHPRSQLYGFLHLGTVGEHFLFQVAKNLPEHWSSLLKVWVEILDENERNAAWNIKKCLEAVVAAKCHFES